MAPSSASRASTRKMSLMSTSPSSVTSVPGAVSDSVDPAMRDIQLSVARLNSSIDAIGSSG